MLCLPLIDPAGFLYFSKQGPYCVEVLTSFYGRFFVEEGQFINSKSLHIVPPLRCHFFQVDSASLWRGES